MTITNAEETADDNDKTTVHGGAEDKGKTFRKRRLSLTHLRQLDNDSSDNEDADADDAAVSSPGSSLLNKKSALNQTEKADYMENEIDSDEKAHTFRKRRLSLTSNNSEAASSLASVNEEHDSPSLKRHRKASDASLSSLGSTNTANSRSIKLQSKTLHAAEILSPSPSYSVSLPKFYQQAAPPQQLPLDESNHKKPKWKERHIRQHAEDDNSLPFPRDVVGTFSCHGVEPMYDNNDLYHPLEDDDEESGVGNQRATPIEKLTMAAKTNQDRGGVAFPYGNSSRTALFAVYDGTHTALHFAARRLSGYTAGNPLTQKICFL